MPSESLNAAAPTEKPQHYTYLKEFRTQQCSLFLQHKCTQHRPFSCFHWHFMNQRRRRPIRRRDGTFSYNPDVYCTKYDETSGFCPDGDDCAYLHRTAGDTERRYHLRYYKTCTCVHETDSRGNCVKNGAHCAFAHGVLDLRPPVYDSRDSQNSPDGLGGGICGGGGLCGGGGKLLDSPLSSSLEKDRIINEDPSWNDTNYVLANYKTELCKRPPRLCRQGYACPSYHNTRDKRRSPKSVKYRSTPCPNVKHGDDWGDPTQCENSDACPYCHTRTEQQFHPEIYKSTKCNDMVQTGYCPRGPFCAFAHVEQEMLTLRDLATPTDNLLGAFLTSALPVTDLKEDPLEGGNTIAELTDRNGDLKASPHYSMSNPMCQQTPGLMRLDSGSSAGMMSHHSGTHAGSVMVGKSRTGSFSSACGSYEKNYARAPGSGREDFQAKLRCQMSLLDHDTSLDSCERLRRRQQLLMLLATSPPPPGGVHPGSLVNMGAVVGSANSQSSQSFASPRSCVFYPDGETVESVVGNALDEDLNLNELSLLAIEPEFGHEENENDKIAVCAAIPEAGYLGVMSVPVTIPSGAAYRRAVSAAVGSADGALLGSLSPPLSCFPKFVPEQQQQQQQQRQEQQLQEAATAFLSQPNPGKYAAAPSSYGSTPVGSGAGAVVASPCGGATVGTPTTSAESFGSNGYLELHRLQEELAANRAKLSRWQDGMSQARGACDAWKKAVEESGKVTRKVEDERKLAVNQRDEALSELTVTRQELELVRRRQLMDCLQTSPDKLSLSDIQCVRARLRLELENLEKLLYQQTTCVACDTQANNNNNGGIHMSALPCQHGAVCDSCAGSYVCPRCPQGGEMMATTAVGDTPLSSAPPV